jgi:PleD family two-component response regulator
MTATSTETVSNIAQAVLSYIRDRFAFVHRANKTTSFVTIFMCVSTRNINPLTSEQFVNFADDEYLTRHVSRILIDKTLEC